MSKREYRNMKWKVGHRQNERRQATSQQSLKCHTLMAGGCWNSLLLLHGSVFWVRVHPCRRRMENVWKTRGGKWKNGKEGRKWEWEEQVWWDDRWEWHSFACLYIHSCLYTLEKKVMRLIFWCVFISFILWLDLDGNGGWMDGWIDGNCGHEKGRKGDEADWQEGRKAWVSDGRKEGNGAQRRCWWQWQQQQNISGRIGQNGTGGVQAAASWHKADKFQWDHFGWAHFWMAWMASMPIGQSWPYLCCKRKKWRKLLIRVRGRTHVENAPWIFTQQNCWKHHIQ